MYVLLVVVEYAVQAKTTVRMTYVRRSVVRALLGRGTFLLSTRACRTIVLRWCFRVTGAHSCEKVPSTSTSGPLLIVEVLGTFSPRARAPATTFQKHHRSTYSTVVRQHIKFFFMWK